MDTRVSRRMRIGALAFGISALLFALFPLIRPFFPLPGQNSPAEFAVVGQAYTSPPWVISHLTAMAALVLLLFGLLTLHAYLAGSGAERHAFAGMALGLGGIALILPTLGVETYALPVIGRLYLDGRAELEPFMRTLYSGPDNMVMVLGLLLLAIGGMFMAVAIWSSGVLPRWAGVILAVGLVAWFPLLPQPVRIADGLLIGIGGLWLAWAMWKKTAGATLAVSMAYE